MSDYERRLLARARELADQTTSVLGGARRAGLDPEALGGLVGAAAALAIGGRGVYAAGRGPGRSYAGEHAVISDLADVEDDLAEREHAAAAFGERVDAALDALDAAQAMPVTEPCNGCHRARSAAIAAAEARTALCEDAVDLLAPLVASLRHAMARVRARPRRPRRDLRAVYSLIRRGGRMPHEGLWIEGAQA